MTRTIATMVLAMFVAAPAAFAQTDETPVKDQTKLQTKTQLNDGACDGDGPIKDVITSYSIHYTKLYENSTKYCPRFTLCIW